jgi:hypothetical protein
VFEGVDPTDLRRHQRSAEVALFASRSENEVGFCEQPTVEPTTRESSCLSGEIAKCVGGLRLHWPARVGMGASACDDKLVRTGAEPVGEGTQHQPFRHS